jgi:hypothetical protein
MHGIILRETAMAESRKSIALGNAQCNELRSSSSSPERAKSFINNRLRPVGALRFYIFILRSALRYAIDFGLSALCYSHRITPSGVYFKDKYGDFLVHPYKISVQGVVAGNVSVGKINTLKLYKNIKK